MIRWTRPLVGAILGVVTMYAHAACNVTISSPTDVNATIAATPAGQTICLNAGTYTTASTFAFNKNVTVIGLGGTPAGVILQAAPAVSSALNFGASGGTLQNLTLQGTAGGIGIPTLSDITLKDLVINTTNSGVVNGVTIIDSTRITIDNVTITPQAAGFYLQNVTASLIMNSTVPSSPVTAGLVVVGGSGNVVVNSTFGSPKVGSTYSFPGGGVVFYNTSGNRFENNTVQGFHDDGVDFTAIDGFPVAAAPATDNYIGKNTVISTGFADNLPAGSGIWTNCGADNSWLYANDSHGTPEQAVVTFMTRSNMFLGNLIHDNKISGVYVSGDTNTPAFCPAAAAQFKNVKPSNTYIKSNSIYFNLNDEVIVRDADNTEFASNFTSAHNGFGGATRDNGLANGFGQSMLGFQTDSRYASSSTMRILANISHDNIRGFQSDDGASLGVTFAFNRLLQPGPNANSRWVVSGVQIWDGGPNVGGNFWSLHAATGNPSNGSQPYGVPGAGVAANGVYYDLSNHTGNIVDRYPFHSEDLGNGGSVTVSEPLAGASVAQGARRTVRWYGPGCVYMDLKLDGTTALASNIGNMGYAVVTIPGGASIGSHTISASCKNSSGTVTGSGSSPAFSVSASTLQVVAPGRDDVFNTGSQIIVAWKKAASIAAVDLDLSTDGGATFTSLGTNLTGTVARVTLPGTVSKAYGVIRVKDHAAATTADTTDGVFAIRGTSGVGFTNISAGRKLAMGHMERLEWASPQNSRLVDLQAQVGATVVTVATSLPDRGYYDWIVPDMGTGTLTLQAVFRTTTGTTIGSPVTNTSGAVSGPNVITINPVGSLGLGNTTTVTASASSGLPVTLTSLTTSVCTISGNVVTGVALGTCTIAGNQAGDGSHAPAAQATVSFSVVSSTNPPRLFNISTRMQVLTGDNVMIAGITIGGSTPKTVAIVATGPSLVPFGISNPLANPSLTLVRQSDSTVIATNDDWQTDANASVLAAQSFAPTNPLEAGLVVTLPPGAYTAIVQGSDGGTGVSVVAAYEIDHPEIPIINISTRGLVLTGNNVMIAGLIIQGSGPQTVLITATGPSLVPFGISNPLPNPMLQLVRQSDSTVIATNDDWQSAPNAAAISATGVAPTDPKESAILITLDPGAYTAIVSGVGGGTGVSVVGVFTE